MMKKRLIQMADYYSLSIRNFEAKCDLKRGNIGNISDNGTIGSDKLAKIIDSFPDVNPEWLITGREPMLRDKTKSTQTTTHASINNAASADNQCKDNKINLINQEKNNKKLIPLVSISAVGGFGNAEFAISENDIKDYYIIPKFKDLHIDFMIEVSGSSMQPKYNSGDVVACTIIRESRFIQWGKVHVIGTREQGIIIKRLYPSNSKSKESIKCISDNEKYLPFEIPESEITGIALVVGVIRLE